MSYINDALHRAQKENKTSWTDGHGIVSSGDKQRGTWQKRYTIIGLSIVFLFAAGMMVLLYWSEIQAGRRSAPIVSEPPTATVAPAEAPVAKNPQQVPETAVPGSVASADINVPAAASMKPTQTPAPTQINAPPVETKVKEPEVASQPAVINLERSEERPPADPKILYAKALQKQRQGKLEEATGLYRQVLQQEPHNIQALNNLGVVHLKMKRYKRAIIRFNEALNIKNDYVDAHYNLACLYARKSDSQKSLFYLKNAINLNPEARNWAADDADLKELAKLPDFQLLMQIRDN